MAAEFLRYMAWLLPIHDAAAANFDDKIRARLGLCRLRLS
jgi:hypothetical protein